MLEVVRMIIHESRCSIASCHSANRRNLVKALKSCIELKKDVERIERMLLDKANMYQV
jgi:hypothetical protein